MAIKNSVSNDFGSTFLDSIGVFDCRLAVWKEFYEVHDVVHQTKNIFQRGREIDKRNANMEFGI